MDARVVHAAKQQLHNAVAAHFCEIEVRVPQHVKQKLTKPQRKMPLQVKANYHELCLVQELGQLGVTHSIDCIQLC